MLVLNEYHKVRRQLYTQLCYSGQYTCQRYKHIDVVFIFFGSTPSNTIFILGVTLLPWREDAHMV